MPDNATVKARKGNIGISKVTGAIRYTVPQGTKLADALKALATIDVSKLGRLPRGCQACLSGHPFDIREEFDPVIDVQLGRGG